MTNVDGSRLESLNHEELKQLLEMRVVDLLKGYSDNRIYTYHVPKVVEVINAMCKHGQYGDRIDAIKLEGPKYA